MMCEVSMHSSGTQMEAEGEMCATLFLFPREHEST